MHIVFSILKVKPTIRNESVEDVEASTLNFNKKNFEKSKIQESIKQSTIVMETKIKKEISKKPLVENPLNSFVASNDGQKMAKNDKPVDKISLINNSLQDSNTFIELSSTFFQLMNENLKQFAYTPAPKGGSVKCVINRDKQGINGGIHPAFYMYCEKEDKKRVLS
jgi:hypothetical protein